MIRHTIEQWLRTIEELEFRLFHNDHIIVYSSAKFYCSGVFLLFELGQKNAIVFKGLKCWDLSLNL